jgi:hypothetical protein
MIVNYQGSACLFGFADKHARTGGLSWTLSTPIQEHVGAYARTLSGRIYHLGDQITEAKLTEEGKIALRLLTDHSPYPEMEDDVRWISAQKMARHLNLLPPPRVVSLVNTFLLENSDRYSSHAMWHSSNRPIS